jgi:DNA-binding LacI/PurR family transcriptional regulator
MCRAMINLLTASIRGAGHVENVVLPTELVRRASA